jgi:hypothetical protein
LSHREELAGAGNKAARTAFLEDNLSDRSFKLTSKLIALIAAHLTVGLTIFNIDDNTSVNGSCVATSAACKLHRDALSIREGNDGFIVSTFAYEAHGGACDHASVGKGSEATRGDAAIGEFKSTTKISRVPYGWYASIKRPTEASR